MSNFVKLKLHSSIQKGSGETYSIEEEEWVNLDYVRSFFTPASKLIFSNGDHRTVASKSIPSLVEAMIEDRIS